jgi:hypothetical protein
MSNHLENLFKDQIIRTVPATGAGSAGRTIDESYPLDTKISGPNSKTESFNVETGPVSVQSANGSYQFFTTGAGNVKFNIHKAESQYVDAYVARNAGISNRRFDSQIVDPKSLEINDASYPRVYYMKIDDNQLFNSIKSAGKTIPGTKIHQIDNNFDGAEIDVAVTKNGINYVAVAIEKNGNYSSLEEDLLGGAQNQSSLAARPEMTAFWNDLTNKDPALKREIKSADDKFIQKGKNQAAGYHLPNVQNLQQWEQDAIKRFPTTIAYNKTPSTPSNTNAPGQQPSGPLASVIPPTPITTPYREGPPIPSAVNVGVKDFKTLIYPMAIANHIGINSTGEGIDYFRLEVKEYVPVSGTGDSTLGSVISSGGLIREQGQGQLNSNNNSLKQVKTKNTIILPIPSNINDSNNVSYTENDLDAVSAALVGGYTNILNSVSMSNPSGAIDVIKDQFNNFYKEQSGVLRTAINASLQAQVANLSPFGVNNVSAESLLARSTGAILNPNKELLFNGVTTRAFKFSFKLTPRNKNEGIVVKQIIRTLKLNMAPKVTTGGNQFLRTPNVFDLSYRRGKDMHPFLNRFKQCALTNMNVNYTGDGVYSTYHDSTPVSMVMNLTFKELEPIYDIDYGDTNDTNSQDIGVGF